MVWVADVPRNISTPIEMEHVALYSYFPQITAGGERPYLWRLLSQSRTLIVSAIRPTSKTAREVRAAIGITYEFKATVKRARNVRGSFTRDDGMRRNRKPRVVTITDPDEMKARVRDFVEKRGGDVRFLRVEGIRELVLGCKRIPICDVLGKVFVRDEASFDAFLASGGPGTGKAYGCGLWYLPEIMGDRHETA